jgi:hypothetical protein
VPPEVAAEPPVAVLDVLPVSLVTIHHGRPFQLDPTATVLFQPEQVSASNSAPRRAEYSGNIPRLFQKTENRQIVCTTCKIHIKLTTRPKIMNLMSTDSQNYKEYSGEIYFHF